MTRKETLTKAIDTVCKNREDDYGSPEDNFKTIADMWTAYTGHKITSGDVAIMMALLKIARIKSGNFKEDSFIDLAGYAACAAEVASNAQTKNEDDIPMDDSDKHNMENPDSTGKRLTVVTTNNTYNVIDPHRTHNGFHYGISVEDCWILYDGIDGFKVTVECCDETFAKSFEDRLNNFRIGRKYTSLYDIFCLLNMREQLESEPNVCESFKHYGWDNKALPLIRIDACDGQRVLFSLGYTFKISDPETEYHKPVKLRMFDGDIHGKE